MQEIKRFFKDWGWADYGLYALLLVFCAYNRLMPILMIVTSLSIFVKHNNWQGIKKLISLRYPFVWFIFYFFAHIIGLLNTENFEFAFSDLGMKMSFIVVPLFLIGARIKINFNALANAYITGLIIACVICYVYAVYRSIHYPEDNHWAYFRESYFSFMMHRSYFATYLALGALISLILFFEAAKFKFFYGFAGVLFVVSMLLTNSKAGVVILVVLMLPLIYYLLGKHYRKIYGLIGVGVAILAMVAVVNLSSNLKARLAKMVNEVVNTEPTQSDSIESNASRLIMWSTSLELFKENPLLGVGTGDVKDELNKRNKALGNYAIAEHSLNAHNQFLNSAVQLGIVGLIPLLGIFVTGLFVGIRRKKTIIIVMQLTFMLTMFFESFLETQAGIIPVTLFSLLFVLKAIDGDVEVITQKEVYS